MGLLRKNLSKELLRKNLSKELDKACFWVYSNTDKKITFAGENQPLQVPQGFIEKPVKVRYDPVTVRGSFGTVVCMAGRSLEEHSGKAFRSVELKSGELLAVDFV